MNKFVLVALFSLSMVGCGKKESSKDIKVKTQGSESQVYVSDIKDDTQNEEGNSDVVMLPSPPIDLEPSTCSDWAVDVELPQSFKNIPCSGTKKRYCLGGGRMNNHLGPVANVVLYKNQHGTKVVISKTSDNNLRSIMAEVCTASENELTSSNYDAELSMANPTEEGLIKIRKVSIPGYETLQTLNQPLYYYQTINN